MKTIKTKKKTIDLTIKKDADTLKPKKKPVTEVKKKFNYKSSKFWEDVYDDDVDNLTLDLSEDE